MKRLENKTAIVTGGNSGIGKATAILFAKEGADLVLCARRKEALDEVAEECRKYGVQVVTVKADVSSHEDCSAVVKAAIDTFRQGGYSGEQCRYCGQAPPDYRVYRRVVG